MEPDPAGEVYGRLDAWLRANAPTTAARARPPAHPTRLSEAERNFGLTLLPSVLGLFRWHDGGGGPADPFWLAPDFGMLSIQGSVREWTTNNEVFIDEYGPPDDDDDWEWNRLWVPIATSWTGDLLVVDHRPAKPGRVITFNHEGPMMDELEHPSVAALLGELYTGLSTNATVNDRGFDIVDGALQWR